MRDGSYCPHDDKTGIDPASWEEMRSFRSVFLTVHYWNF